MNDYPSILLIGLFIGFIYAAIIGHFEKSQVTAAGVLGAFFAVLFYFFFGGTDLTASIILCFIGAAINIAFYLRYMQRGSAL